MSQINKSSNKGILNNFTKSFLSIFAILAMFGSVYGGYVYFKDNLSTDNNTDTAKAASTTFSNGNISFDKKYVVGGIEYDTLDNANAVAQGSTVTVRLRYNNTGDTALSGASIKDTLPGGFTLQDGSVKACLNPSVTETICGANIPAATANTTLFGSTGTSPIAGLYDGADTGAVGTAVASSSGLVEMGKKRYLHVLQCSVTIDQDYATRAFRAKNDTTFLPQTDCASGTTYTGVMVIFNPGQASVANGSGGNPGYVELKGSRYLHILACTTTPSQDFSIREWNARNTTSLIPTSDCGGAGYTSSGIGLATNTINGNPVYADALSKRYLHLLQCTPPTQDYFPRRLEFSNSTTISSTDCGTSGYVSTGIGVLTEIGNSNPNYTDLLDTTRGSGYIEYKMTAPSFTTPSDQKYSTAATLSTTGSTITALNDGTVGNGTTLGDITVSATPRPNGDITKEYSIDGINWCDKLDGTPSTCPTVAPGEPIKVRLRYENTGNASATVASIKDSLPSNKFSYIPNTFKNCLNPDYPTTNEVICDTLSNTNKNTAFTTLTSATGISPVAGLYDANSASAAGGTSVTSTSGTLEIGKKRYVNHAICDYINLYTTNGVNRWRFDGAAASNTTNYFADLGTYRTNTNKPAACSGPDPAAFTNFLVDTLGNRYINHAICDYNNIAPSGYNPWRFDGAAASNTTNYFADLGTYRTNTNKPAACSGPDPAAFTNFLVDTLGNRYINHAICDYNNLYTTGSDPWRFDGAAASNTTNYFADLGTYRTNTNKPAACSGPDPAAFGNNLVDTLSSSRSTGYIYYEMTTASDTTAGSYGTTTTVLKIADVGFVSTVPTGSATDITVSSDPAFSIKKVLANIGTGTVCPTTESSYTSTISGVNAGDKVCVRLKYQNKTNGAVSNAAIADSLTASQGLTYITASTKNCLTPETGAELCASDASMAGAGWTGNNGWASTNFALAPHAGFYGQAVSGTGSTASTMEMGKKRYLQGIQCSDSRGPDTFIGAASNENLGAYPGIVGTTSNGNCSDFGFNTPYFRSGGYQIDILGKAYLQSIQCQTTAFGPDTFPAGSSNTNTPYTGTVGTTGGCIDFDSAPPSGWLKSGDIIINTLSNRYMQTLQCGSDTFGSDTFVGGLSNTNIIYPDAGSLGGCADFAFTSPWFRSGSFQTDLLYTPNGRGYIQYQLQTSSTNSVSTITLPNVSLSGTGQTTSTSNAVINFASIPLTPTDIPSLLVTCGVTGTAGGVGSGVVNSTTTCNFVLPPNKTLPTDFKLSIGTGSVNQLNCNNTTTPNTPGCNSANTAVAQACTLTSGTVTCNNIPTGNSIGNIPIYGQFTGTAGSKTPTGETVNIVGINFGGITWTFTPNQGGTAPLFRNTDDTTININNFKTILDPTPTSNTRYTCNLEYRKINDRLATTPPTWTTISTTPTPYTTGNTTNSGCSFTLTKAMRLNNLNYSLRLTITDTAITNPNTTTNPNTYTFYNEYIYRFQGAGVASGG